ncbi:MAG: CYTH domain-containing protein [Faecalimonas sp.]|nr:CYTH domain-containing protein [Faecalimonas sp.]
MEIERKFLVRQLPNNLEQYAARHLEQGYLCVAPVVRIRRDNEQYELTYKSGGMMVRQEYNLPLMRESYEHLKTKIDGRLIVKTRYMIPYDKYMIELDVFEQDLAPLIIAEVEFESEEEAKAFTAPEWFGEDVTFSKLYHNSYLSRM